MLSAPRTDPYVRLSRIRLLPRVCDGTLQLQFAVCDPAPVSRLSGAASGTCFAGSHSPWSQPLAPPTPQQIAPPCSPASQLLWSGPTSRVRASSASAPHLPDADLGGNVPNGRTRDLPGSDVFLSCVMCSSTTAERQSLAKRDRTCCLRRCLPARPLRFYGFRGSIAHPTQSLCTLRARRCRRPRNTRYRAPATAYPDRSLTGRTTPACLAHKQSISPHAARWIASPRSQ